MFVGQHHIFFSTLGESLGVTETIVVIFGVVAGSISTDRRVMFTPGLRTNEGANGRMSPVRAKFALIFCAASKMK